MSCIHYKFKSSLDYNSITFDGLHMSLADLKKAIGLQKHLKPGEFDLEITNAQTGDVYKKNDELIAKNTSVIVSRVPVNKTTASSTQRSWEAFKQACAEVKEKEKQMTLEKLKQTPDIAHAPASELDKIIAVIDQSKKGFEPSNFVGKFQTGVPHDNYVCKRCGQKGHYVSNCPNTNSEDRIIEPRYKRTTGIPSSMLTIVDNPLHPGSLLTPHGQFAVPTVDVMGYREGKKERPPFAPPLKDSEPEKKKIPQELLCHICEDLCVEAAIAPCCGTSFCDECLREVLLESDDHKCPSCKEINVSPDKIVPNKSMRLAVLNFLSGTGYTKAKKRRLSSHSSDSSSQVPTSSSDKPQSPGRHPFRESQNSSQNNNSSPTYNEPDIPNKSRGPTSNVHHFIPKTTVPSAHHHYNYSRPPKFNQFSKPWRFAAEQNATEGSNISTISRRGDVTEGPYKRSHADEPPPASQSVDTSSASGNQKASTAESGAPRASPLVSITSQGNAVHPPIAQPVWPTTVSGPSVTAPVLQMNPVLPVLALSAILNARPPLLPLPQTQGQPYLGGFPHSFPDHQPNVPLIHPTVPTGGVPLSREEFYQAKKMFQTNEAPDKKKPVDVFESFADFTKRRSRTPERRRSFTRSRSGSWNKRGSRTPSVSPGNRRSRSLSSRRFSPRSRSRSRQHSQIRSRSKSVLRSQNRSRSRSTSRLPPNRSRSRSFESSRLSRQRPKSHTPGRLSKSRSRSRSGPRQSKAVSPGPRSPRSPLRRSTKSPLPTLRSRSRSFGRFSRSRSKSWTKRARSRSFSRPRSPRPLSRSPRRSPKRSPYRSPIRKRSFSPRRRSRSFSPPRRSPFRSRSRTPLSKRKFSRSRSRSPTRKRSYTPQLSPRRSKSPYKKPLSPVPFKRRSPSPFRGRGGFRGRGRGSYGYRDNRDKFRNYRSPPRNPVPPGPSVPLSTGNLPPVPYFPQMGLPPPEEYFKYNPDGYQEFVKSFYAQFGPQTQSWAQNPPFPPAADDRFPLNNPTANPAASNQRPAWEAVPMSPSQRPRSLTPPGGGSLRDRKDQPPNRDKDGHLQIYSKERDSHVQNYRGRDSHGTRIWEKDDQDRDRLRDGRRLERGRAINSYRGRDRDKRGHSKEDDRHRARDNHRDRDFRDSENSRNRDFRNHENLRNKDFRENENSRNRDFRDSENSKNRDFRDGENSKNRDFRDNENSTNRDRSVDRRKSPPGKSKDEDKSKDKGRKRSEKGKDEKETKKISRKTESDTRKESTDVKDSIIAKASPVSDKELESPKAEQKPANDSLQVKNESADKPQLGNVPNKAEVGPTLNTESGTTVSKPPVKEKKTVSKKKGDGVGGKKKAKDASVEDGTEKKVKKTKKKKITFGASDVDTKQGLKKKKLKRLVDYKSENCTSEDGEERVSLGGSPLKKAKLAELNQIKEESLDKLDSSSKSVSEPIKEIGTEIKPEQEENKLIKQEAETVVAHAVGGGKVAEEKAAPDRLIPELPELSKWERDDFDYFDSVDHKKEKPQEKQMLPRSVVDKAEKFLTHKPMKNAVMVTASNRSPEPAPERHTAEHTSSSPQSKSLRRVFIDHRRDSKEMKQPDLQITVKADKRREHTDKRGSTLVKSDDHHRYHRHNLGGYEEDQRSVIKSNSLERELHDSKGSSRNAKDREGYSRKDRSSRGNVHESIQKQDSSRRDKNESNKDKHRDRSPEQRERKQDRENTSSSHLESSKSSKDLRHKLEEKNKSKSTVDHRKLSVMDESEFVPDYEDLGPEGASDKEHDNAAVSHNSGPSSPDSKNKKKNKDSEESGKGEDGKDSSEEAGKKKSKKKHKHKEKKEKHKHKKKKHKHKKEKEKDGKQKSSKEDGSP